MPSAALTGAEGFLGWHTQVTARALGTVDVYPIGRSEMNNPELLLRLVDGVDHVVHAAGVNRGSDEQVHDGNVALAEQLAVALRAARRPPRSLSFANSTQAGSGSPYGRAKARAAEILARVCASTSTSFHDEQLPNLFGEHSRPFYNSVVATFCSEAAHDRAPVVHEDREVTLLAVRDASALLLAPVTGVEGKPPSLARISVSELRAKIVAFHECYRTGEIPYLADLFAVRLFNTYRSFTFPWRFPIALQRRSDGRGSLVETVRVHGGGGQAFVSTTRPGVTRGEHYHLDKIERFVVVEGSATISLRRVLHKDVVTFEVNGDSPVIVDMPTLWTHNITNVGSTTLHTQFWTDQLFDPVAPDTYYEDV